MPLAETSTGSYKGEVIEPRVRGQGQQKSLGIAHASDWVPLVTKKKPNERRFVGPSEDYIAPDTAERNFYDSLKYCLSCARHRN